MNSHDKFADVSWKAEEIRRGQQLVTAAGTGNVVEVVRLLDAGVSVDAEEYNKSLFYASKNYVTPLQLACEKNKFLCVRVLIEAGADVNAKDRFDITGVHMAAERGHYLCLRYLLDAGADCSIPTKPSKKGCYTAIPHPGGTTPLHLAAANNHVACVKELIQSGADYNAIDEKGRTSLYLATQAGFEECVLAHLRNAVGRDILSLPSFETGDTPLHFAVRNGMVECVQELLNLGSDPNHINHTGASPLHYAVSYNTEIESCCEKIINLLVLEGYNVDVNLPDSTGFTPLHYVSFTAGVSFVRRPRLARFLIAHGADPQIKNQRGYNLIESELKGINHDLSILRTVVQSMSILPPLQSLKITIPPFPAPVTLQSYHLLPMEQSFFDFERDPPSSLQMRFQQVNTQSKCQWYALVTSQPRTLQHCCRFQIRKSLGPKRLRHIKDLRIPTKLQHYLMLETDKI